MVEKSNAKHGYLKAKTIQTDVDDYFNINVFLEVFRT